MEVRQVSLRRPPGEKAEAILEPERVRYGADEGASRPQDSASLRDDRLGFAKVFEKLTGHDDIEGLILERQWVFNIGPQSLYSQPGCPLQRVSIDVDTDDVVSSGVGAGDRAIAATEVENATPGPAHVTLEQLDALTPAEDELRRAGRSVVMPIAFARAVAPTHAA
jgi:hypothetical protein